MKRSNMDRVSPNLTNLPIELLVSIFEMCDVQSLGRLARTCKTFKEIVYSEDSIWQKRSKWVIGSNTASEAMKKRCNPVLDFRKRCEVAKYWKKSLGTKRKIAIYKKSMPWLVLEKDRLYCSIRAVLKQYSRNTHGHSGVFAKKLAVAGRDDISKFCVNPNEVITGGRDGRIARWSKEDLHYIRSVQAHSKDVLCVDSVNDVIVSGSKDSSVKIWRAAPAYTLCLTEIKMNIRILSLAIMPPGVHFVAGMPGTHNIHPIQLYDIERGAHVCNLGETFSKGAGVMDIYPECQNTLLTCGHDSAIKLWDVRDPRRCISEFEEPYNNGIYCVRSDHNITILSGAQRNGIIHLWDKRMCNKPLKVFSSTAKYHNSPVYCLGFDSTHIYAAFDRMLYQYAYN